MSAADPSGSQLFWFNGVPFPGLNRVTSLTGAKFYFFNGLPVRTIYPVFVPPSGGNGNGKGNGNGNNKGGKKTSDAWLTFQRFHRKKRKRRDYECDSTAFIPQQYLSPISGKTSSIGIGAPDIRHVTRRITSSPGGHTVRKDNA